MHLCAFGYVKHDLSKSKILDASVCHSCMARHEGAVRAVMVTCFLLSSVMQGRSFDDLSWVLDFELLMWKKSKGTEAVMKNGFSIYCTMQFEHASRVSEYLLVSKKCV